MDWVGAAKGVGERLRGQERKAIVLLFQLHINACLQPVL